MVFLLQESPTFQYVATEFLGSQVPEMAICQVMNFGNMEGNRELFR